MVKVRNRDTSSRTATLSSGNWKSAAEFLLPLAPALIIYSLLAYQFSFIQDDAFITFRYVANFLEGHGLVYNVGERIEGFTNFGWTIYLSAWSVTGANYITVATITGFLLGMGAIVVTYLTARRLFTDKLRWPAFVPVYLMACNQSLAYWSPAGLETAAFTFMVTLCLYLFLKRSRFLAAGLMLAVWVRPEGALVAGLLIVIEAALERRFPWYSFGAAAIAFVSSLPWLGFKWSYYGSILPNPFYAKTGLTFDQVQNGSSYAWEFFRDYGFLGLTWLIPLVFFRRLSNAMKAVWLFCVLYAAYLVLIGGDVLKVHRFFLPILGGSAVLAAVSLETLTKSLEGRKRMVSIAVVSLALLGLTYYLPLKSVQYFNLKEKSLIIKMSFLAQQLQKYDSSNFSVATTTIGALGYTLIGHDVIDMLGLTDSTVARHPETAIANLESTWKESKFNSQYVLTKAPDYVVFSTDQKPSAPAEQALMLRPPFLKSYRVISWQYSDPSGRPEKRAISAYVKVRPVDALPDSLLPAQWVADYKEGLENYTAGDNAGALTSLAHAQTLVNGVRYPELLYAIAGCYARTKRGDQSLAYLDSAIASDSLAEPAHGQLYVMAALSGDTADAAFHRRWVQRLAPWDLMWRDSTIRAALVKLQRP